MILRACILRNAIQLNIRYSFINSNLFSYFRLYKKLNVDSKRTTTIRSVNDMVFKGEEWNHPWVVKDFGLLFCNLFIFFTKRIKQKIFAFFLSDGAAYLFIRTSNWNPLFSKFLLSDGLFSRCEYFYSIVNPLVLNKMI